MSSSVMLIVLFAAILHALWNFLIKQGADKHINMTAIVLGNIPFAAVALCFVPLPKVESLPYIIIAAFIHTGYELFLLYSYKIGDLSQVYPLARGTSPLVVTVTSVLFLGTSLAYTQLTAIVIISAGIMSLSLVKRSDGEKNYQAAFLAITTGVFIASYSLVDGIGARIATTALGYYSCLSIVNALLFSVIICFLKPGTIKTVIKKQYSLALLGGSSSFVAYALVVWAFTVAPIALVTALRETSVIFAIFLGVFVLKEPLDRGKLLAVFLTFVGAVLLRFNH